MPSLDDIVSCKIHPGIGIARVGNSQEGFFIGPEIPGVYEPPLGGYKDSGDPALGRPPAVKRQAARFRIYGYDAQGNVVQELNAGQADVRWTVVLANKKAEWHKFNGSDGELAPSMMPRRNPKVADRSSLIIGASPATVSREVQTAELIGTLWVARPPRSVPLGEIRFESDGRLLVLGGFGKSDTWNNSPIQEYANNDGWYDDVSDGPVTATVTLNGRQLPVEPSWIIIGPPDFAPGIANIVTLYDVAYEAAVVRGWFPAPNSALQPSFNEDLLPILSSTLALQWTNQAALAGHGPDGGGDFLKTWTDLGNSQSASRPWRKEVFDVLRNPNLPSDDEEAARQAGVDFMPMLSGDGGDAKDRQFKTWLTLTKTQYEIMRRWAEGDFAMGGPMSPVRGTPHDLDRAALETCVGGAFFPGIEASWILRRASIYKEPFRINHAYLDEVEPDNPPFGPGDVTKYGAVPWQADFYDCQTDRDPNNVDPKVGWWPAQRPDEILTLDKFNQIKQLSAKLAGLDPNSPEFHQKQNQLKQLWRKRDAWTRGFKDGRVEMVSNWHRLGFVVDRQEDGNPLVLNGQPQFVEIGRDPNLQET